MDRDLYQKTFRLDRLPKWGCPSCDTGVLQLKDGTFAHDMSAHSKRNQSHPEWGPDWMSYVYSCFLVCSEESCEETVASNGTGAMESYMETDPDRFPCQRWAAHFTPSYFQPSLKMFALPAELPEDIKTEIYKSFSLFFCDTAAALDHVGNALEHVLNHLKVKKTALNKDKKRRPLSLPARIGVIPKKHAHLKPYLKAIKWCNVARSNIISDDVLDTYTIMETVLGEVFEQEPVPVKKVVRLRSA